MHLYSGMADQGANFPAERADDKHVADMQRAALHQHRRHRATAPLQLGFDDSAFRQPVRIRLQFQHFGLEQNHLEQLIEAGLLFGRDLDHDRVAAPGFGDQAMFGECIPHAIRIGAGLVDLVDGHNERNAGGFGVMNRFDRLRHDAVVCCHDQDDDIRDLGATRAHGGEGLMARRIEERHLLATDADRIGADVLRNAAGFAFRHLRLTDRIQQRCFAVVDMAHDRHDRRPRLELGFAFAPA